MAGFFGKLIEFLLGFLLVPIVVGVIAFVIGLLLSPTLGVNNEAQLIANMQIISLILQGVILLLLFLIRKMVAIGYLTSMILDFVVGFAVTSFVNIPSGSP